LAVPEGLGGQKGYENDDLPAKNGFFDVADTKRGARKIF
jgi:hypothetical protein